MKSRQAILGVVLGLLAAGAVAADAPDLAGSWQGMLKVGGSVELRLVFHVERREEGWSGSLDSPDQGASGIPLSAVSVDGVRVRFAVDVVGGGFEGTMAAGGESIAGVWKQGGMELPLTLAPVGEEAVAEPRRPQEPPPEVPYRVEEVAYSSLAEGVEIAGTLTLPEGEGPFPAVLLISGSGPQDRDEALLRHRPFAVLADYLTRHGIAVLRVDDRGVGESSGDFAAATSEDFAVDALAGFRWLRAREETDPRRVGLLGHSEGGLVAPMVAVEEPAVAFLVLLAPPGVSGEQLLYRQGEELARAAGADDSAVREQRVLQERLFTAVREAQSDEQARQRVSQVLREALATVPEEDRDEAAAALEMQSGQVTSPWFRFFLVHDPLPVLKQVGDPVLALWGGKDLQVPPDQSRPPIEQALESRGNLSLRVFPELNHLFQTAETGHPTEYGRIEETIAPAVLETIAAWILDLDARDDDDPVSREPADTSPPE